MKLIIDIDDELVKTAKFAVQNDMGSDYVRSIANGTPQALEQTKWIPVSEGLPETDDDVLITADNGEIYLGFIYKYDSKSWYINSKEYHEPIAWMPLPSTYQLQERNEE